MKTKIRNHANIVKHHPEDPYSQSKTEAQWRKEGRVIIGPGELMYTNSNGWVKVRYYNPDETREATPEEVTAWKDAQQAQREANRQKKQAAMEAEANREKARHAAQLERLRRYVDLDPASIICFDTETTGVGPDDEILQLSIIDGRGEVLIDDYFRPKNIAEWPEAQDIHGISPEMVADKPHVEDCVSQINAIFANAKLIVGYNMSFDIGFIRRAGITIPAEISRFDVMPEFAEIYGEWNSYYKNYRWQKLCDCAEYFGYEGSAFHDSLEDVRATLYCYFAMTKYDFVNTQ